MPEGIKRPSRNPDNWTPQQREDDERYARIVRRHGISNALRIVQEARREGVGPATALALIEKESRGRNLFGHDRDSRGRYIFPARDGDVLVTRNLYSEYLRRRGRHGEGGMQGVGPSQLTYYALQDEADKEGGCWNPRLNIRVGLRQLRRLIVAEDSLRDGYRRYNGSGPAAETYARDALAKREVWQRRLGIDD